MKKAKMACGGKAKSYKKGGKVCPTCNSAKCSCKKMKKGGKVDVGGVKMKSGGMCRGGGAATRGMNISKKMG
jgi:hypothetical protein